MMSKETEGPQDCLASVQHTKLLLQNKKSVIVGQTMVKDEETESEGVVEAHAKVENSQIDLQGDIKMQVQNILPHQSLPQSLKSSNSSIAGSPFSVSDVNMLTVENDVLDELRSEIATSATQFMKLQSEIGGISVLKKKISEIESEKRLLTNELSEKCGIIETMKQRLSVLHEQNSQLAQLTRSSPDSSETTLRMRNALVASLTQLKRLQETADQLPVLKAKVSYLQEENLKLKELEQKSVEQLPVGVTLLDYKSSLDELNKFRALNRPEISQIVENFDSLSKSLEDIKKRLTTFEKSLNNSVSVMNSIERLEKENRELYDEIIQLKLCNSISHSMDTVYLDNQCTVLRKANSELQSNIEKLILHSKQEKDKIVMKLFEVEMSSYRSQKFDIEKRLSDLNLLEVSLVDPHAMTDYHSVECYTSLSPQFKTQILKLHQFQLQREQSKYILQLVLSEKAELEERLNVVTTLLEDKSIQELEYNLRDYKNKLAIAQAKIGDLEGRLSCISSVSQSSDHATLVSENISLKTQLSSMHQHEQNSVELLEIKKKLLDEQQLHETSILKYKKCKDQKQKLESKLKESKCRYQSLASELSNAVQLMNNYQLQCLQFEQEIDLIKAERESFHKEVISLKADLETLRAEHSDSNVNGAKIEEEIKSDTISNFSNIEVLASENLTLKHDIEAMRREIEDKSCKLKAMKVEYDDICAQFSEKEKCFDSQQTVATTLEEEVKAYRMKLELFEEKVHKLEQEKAVLSSNLEDMLKHHIEEKSKLTEDHCNNVSALEAHLSHQSSVIDHYKADNSELLITLSARDASISELTHRLRLKQSEESACANQNNRQKNDDEIEGYKAMIKNLQRQLDEAELREIEHEHLKQKMKMLEVAVHDPSCDKKSLARTLQGSIPSNFLDKISLQERNLQLEEQVSVLSQWNDKQRKEIEELEMMLKESSSGYQMLVEEIRSKDYLSEENSQLKRELKEVEIELNALRRQVKADLQEELLLKLETKTQLLAVFNQHNTLLQKQVEELQTQVKILGGKLDRERAASPPPMPDVAISLCNTDREGCTPQSLSALEKENGLLKQRIAVIETELDRFHCMSAAIHRCSSRLHALSSISVGTINEEVLVTVPNEMLVPCSLLSDHLKLNASLDDSVAQTWINSICTEWFMCVSQKALTPACAQFYISTISQLSHKLLDVVINLQDDKGNTVLHHTAANGNLPALYQFVSLQSCDPTITNLAGYNALMLLSSCISEIDTAEYKEVLDTLIERSGLNFAANKNQQTALMLAAGSGKFSLVSYFIQKECDINLKDKDGSTALMFAVQMGHENIVKVLISCSNCDLLTKDNEGKTAKDIAKSSGFHNIMLLLKKK